MTRPLEFSDLDDLVTRYLSGASIKQLAIERGCSRGALTRALRLAGVSLRDRAEAGRASWQAIKRTDGWRERFLAKAWAAADARNADIERAVISLYRNGLTSARMIAMRLGVAKPTVLDMLKRRGLGGDRWNHRRAAANVGGFNAAMQCKVEPAFGAQFVARGLDFVHQAAIGTRNVDFSFHAERVAVEIVRRHWNDAKSLRRERLEQIFCAGWRMFIVYDPVQRGIDIGACTDQLVAFLEFVRGNPSAPGQYWMVDGEAQPFPESRVQLHHFSRIPCPLTGDRVAAH
ncbi:helix-turn-helix domain-containing protein [Sulfuritortus calidifontis]|uniref:helix-turn-helix domain-containing protein n=1 Tax=Sulfuritortus calidifontis TaxID=1914471 RepID=UPI003B846DF7